MRIESRRCVFLGLLSPFLLNCYVLRCMFGGKCTENVCVCGFVGPPKMKRPMETNQLEMGPPTSKRACLERGATKQHSPPAPATELAVTGVSSPLPPSAGGVHGTCRVRSGTARSLSFQLTVVEIA